MEGKEKRVGKQHIGGGQNPHKPKMGEVAVREELGAVPFLLQLELLQLVVTTSYSLLQIHHRPPPVIYHTTT